MRTKVALTLVLLLLVTIVAAACSSSPAPANAPASTKPVAEAPKASTSPPASSSAAAKPAGTSAPSPAANADWKAEWDRTLAAARKEGKVVIGGGRAEPYRIASLEFEKAYPGIKVEYTGFAGPDFGPKIGAERQAGQYLWDVFMSGPTTIQSSLKPAGFLDPLKPAFLLPEVRDDRYWADGLDDGWMDKDKQYVYSFDGSVNYLAYVNRDLVPESELNSIDQLLDPKWKGKITILDPRIGGGGSTASATILMVRGEDWLRKFLAQDLVVTAEARAQSEFVFRGRYPIGIRLSPADIQMFTEQGLGKNVKPLDPTGPAAAAMGVGFCCMALINHQQNPNAVRVFINWWLSKEGQTAYVKASNNNSRRLDLDVRGNPQTASNPKVTYPNPAKEEALDFTRRAIEMAKGIIK